MLLRLYHIYSMTSIQLCFSLPIFSLNTIFCLFMLNWCIRFFFIFFYLGCCLLHPAKIVLCDICVHAPLSTLYFSQYSRAPVSQQQLCCDYERSAFLFTVSIEFYERGLVADVQLLFVCTMLLIFRLFVLISFTARLNLHFKCILKQSRQLDIDDETSQRHLYPELQNIST